MREASFVEEQKSSAVPRLEEQCCNTTCRVVSVSLPRDWIRNEQPQQQHVELHFSFPIIS